MTALEGIRVVDLTRVLSGPWCAMQLADLGAEVLKIENPAGGDETRGFLPPARDGHSTCFLTVNRNKKSIAVDITRPEGADIVRELVKLRRGKTEWQATPPLRTHLPRQAPKYLSPDLRRAKSRIRRLLDHA